MATPYNSLLFFLLFATIFPVATLVLAKMVRPSNPSKVKLEAYECGIPADTNARSRFSVRYYIVAIVFVIFDAETLFLFPWAVQYRLLGWFGVGEAGVFLAILLVGYLWAYREGAFDWV